MWNCRAFAGIAWHWHPPKPLISFRKPPYFFPSLFVVVRLSALASHLLVLAIGLDMFSGMLVTSLCKAFKGAIAKWRRTY
jgi:hypothetical protein